MPKNMFLIILKKLFDISGQVAVVTGGGGVLCGEMAKALGADAVGIGPIERYDKDPA